MKLTSTSTIIVVFTIILSIEKLSSLFYVQHLDLPLERLALIDAQIVAEIEKHQPPEGFPWHRWDIEKYKTKFHKNLLDAFQKKSPNPYTRYVIRNGTLYCPEIDIANVTIKKRGGRKWKGRNMRLYPIERTINEAIQLGKSAELLANQRVKAAMSLLLENNEKGTSVGVPFLLDRGDAIDCQENFPVFRFTRVQDRLHCNTSWTFPEYTMLNGIDRIKNGTDET